MNKQPYIKVTNDGEHSSVEVKGHTNEIVNMVNVLMKTLPPEILMLLMLCELEE